MYACGVEPKLSQSLDGLSLNFFSIFIPAFLLDSNNSGSKFLNIDGGPCPSTGDPVYLLKVVSAGYSSSLLGISVKVFPLEF